jgi:hypothetical protein
MPSRIIREGILTSDRIDSLSVHAEVFYRRVMSVVDDFGRFSAKPALLLASCYPLKLKSVAEEDIQAWLAECVAADLIVVYQVGSKTFLEMQDFKQQVRAKVSKYPAPDTNLTSKCVADAEQLKSSVHLGGGGVVSQDGGGGESDAAGANVKTKPVDLSIAFRAGGVMTQPADPRLIALSQQGVTVETVKAACEEAQRAKPGESVGLGYVAKILERWAKEASELKTNGAANPKAIPAAKPILPIDQQIPSLARVEKTDRTDAAQGEAMAHIRKLVRGASP